MPLPTVLIWVTVSAIATWLVMRRVARLLARWLYAPASGAPGSD
ncbi:hypothetical protein [Nakamurella sp.]